MTDEPVPAYTDDKTLKLLMDAFNGDPKAAYLRLLAAFSLSACFIERSPADVQQHIEIAMAGANAAIKNNPKIFGGFANDR